MIRANDRSPDVEAPRGSGRGAGAKQVQVSQPKSTAPAHGAPVRCACCRRPIVGARTALLGVHSVCWTVAGDRIGTVTQAAIERQHQAERDAWLDEYADAEQRLQAEGFLR